MVDDIFIISVPLGGSHDPIASPIAAAGAVPVRFIRSEHSSIVIFIIMMEGCGLPVAYAALVGQMSGVDSVAGVSVHLQVYPTAHVGADVEHHDVLLA